MTAAAEESSGGRREGEIAGSSAILFLAQVAGNAGYLVAVLVLARGLGPSGRGSVAFMTVTALVAARLATLGLSNAVSVLAAQREEARASLLTNSLAFAVAASVFASALVCGALVLLGDVRPAGITALGLASVGVGIGAIALQEEALAYLQGTRRFVARSAATVAGTWLYAVLLLGVWQLSGLTVTRGAVTWAVGQVLIGFILIGASARVAGMGRFDRPLLAECLRFGVRAWLGTLARFLNFRLDQILMGFLVSEATLGAYAVAVNASEILLYLPSAVGLVLVPVIARREPHERLPTALLAFRGMTLVTGLSCLVAVVLGPPLLPAVFGSGFDASVDPFVLLVPGALGFGALTVFASALVASDSPGRSSLGPIVALVTGVGLDLALIPPFEANGAAAAASLAFLLGGAASLWAYRRVADFSLAELVPRARDVAVVRELVRLRFTRRRPASGGEPGA